MPSDVLMLFRALYKKNLVHSFGSLNAICYTILKLSLHPLLLRREIA